MELLVTVDCLSVLCEIPEKFSFRVIALLKSPDVWDVVLNHVLLSIDAITFYVVCILRYNMGSP